MTPDEIRKHEIEKRNKERMDGGPGSGPRKLGEGSDESEAAHIASAKAEDSGTEKDHQNAINAHNRAAQAHFEEAGYTMNPATRFHQKMIEHHARARGRRTV